MWNSVKIVKLVPILECLYSWTKTGGYIISELYKIWRVYRDDGRLSRELEVIFIVVGGCLSQLEVACNKGRYRAARHMGREDDLSQKKSTIPKLNVIFFILVVRVSSQNFKIGPLQDFEKMRFWPILGLFLILGHFRAVFGPFFGGFKFFGH